LSDYIETIVAKRYRNYLREEERKTRRSEWTQHFITVLLWLLKLIANILEKVGIKGKSKRIIEKVTVE
jgi:septin family protein